tara:strand:+ start:2615 stop:2875 length:261 start_codon:yes stop_codon:yes gene_type:complete
MQIEVGITKKDVSHFMEIYRLHCQEIENELKKINCILWVIVQKEVETNKGKTFTELFQKFDGQLQKEEDQIKEWLTKAIGKFGGLV